MRTNVQPTNAMTITEDTTFASGVYVLPDGIRIASDHVTVRGSGTTIVSGRQTGVGVHAEGQTGINVEDLAITGFYHGVRFDDCRDVSLKRLTIRGTAEIEGIDTFLYLWLPIQKAYGGAVLFNRTEKGSIRQCDIQHQMNGILLYDCDGITTEANNASFNSGWGIYLSHTCNSALQDNQLDFCNRLYRRPENGSIRVEADAAGIVLVKGSSNNRLLRNSCLCGGDGIFIAGYEHPGKIEPCNDNLIEDNDCRLSPNNAIESTFSKGNTFRRNDCSRSNYGFWMGYSHDNLIEDNTVEFNRWAGIAIEHGFDFVIRDNRIRLNGEGIRLWTRGGSLVEYFPDRVVAHDITVEDNLIESNTTGLKAYTGDATPGDEACHHFFVRSNQFHDNRIGVNFGHVRDCALTGNQFTHHVEVAIRLDSTAGVTVADDNRFEYNRSNTQP